MRHSISIGGGVAWLSAGDYEGLTAYAKAMDLESLSASWEASNSLQFGLTDYKQGLQLCSPRGWHSPRSIEVAGQGARVPFQVPGHLSERHTKLPSFGLQAL
jgi:hypothetical protein